ncbi:MAG: HEAT repeat domain-containing protein [Planctomycetaceae bacterium]
MMKWTVRYSAAAVLFGMSAAAQAGLLGGLFSHGSHGEDCCPEACAPVVARPCEKTFTYQRECSNLQPPCCDEGCCPAECAAPCDAGVAPGCANECGPSGCSTKRSGCGGLLKKLFGGHKKHGGLCGHSEDCCDTGCAGECCGPPLECGDPCEIATLIYEAQTSCYAKDRSKAIDKLGDFDCRCHPEIMTVLVYSLNDSDERVRAQAADEIGDLISKGRCCCSQEVVAALTCALGDCDRNVRDQAEEALEICGYEVVEGCCQGGCGDAGCVATGNVPTPAPVTVPAKQAPVAPVPAPAAAPAPAPAAAPAPPAPMPMDAEAAPAPAPPEDPEAYFPSRYRKQTSTQGALSNLFSMN